MKTLAILQVNNDGESVTFSSHGVILRWDESKREYVTHLFTERRDNGERDYFWGHYHSDSVREAGDDFKARVASFFNLYAR